MFDLGPPPKLWTPPKPAIIRAASLRDIEPRGKAMLPGMFPVIASLPSYRYWVLDITAVVSGSAGVQILEMQLMNGGVDQVPTMTANNAPSPIVLTASAEYDSNYAAWKAFNNTSSGQGWDTTGGSPSPGLPSWIKVDFGAVKRITSYSIHPANQDIYKPKDFTLSASNNDSNYITLDTRSGITWSGDETKTFTIAAY